MLVQLSPHNQCGTNPNNLPQQTLVPLSTDWCPLALTEPTPQSTSDRLHTRAHTGLTPAGPPLTSSTHEHTRASTHNPLRFGPTPLECARAQEIVDLALIPIVGTEDR